MRGLSLRPRRPLWLVTLADLALLLVGFFVFVHAVAEESAAERAAIAAGIRDAFGGDGAVAPALSLDINRVGFAAGSAVPPDLAPIRAWLADAAADPRTKVMVTGFDPLDLGLAARRAEAVAARLALPPDRVRRAAQVRAGPPRADLSISFDP
jgi:hypothetical protein